MQLSFLQHAHRAGLCYTGWSQLPRGLSLASQDEWPLLVIVPASLRLVWAEELEKWLPHLRPSCIHVIEGKEDRVGQVGRHDRGIGAGRSYRSTVGTTRDSGG